MGRLLAIVFVIGFGLSWLMSPSPSAQSAAAPTSPVRVLDSPRKHDAGESRGMSAGGEMTTIIDRDGSGQFHVTADVNGQNTTFLIDTGADAVGLTVDEARRLGVYVDPNGFQDISKTASGVGRGTVVELASIRINGRELDHVEALVMEGLEVNLLGQNVLRRLGKVELEGDRMILR